MEGLKNFKAEKILGSGSRLNGQVQLFSVIKSEQMFTVDGTVQILDECQT